MGIKVGKLSPPTQPPRPSSNGSNTNHHSVPQLSETPSLLSKQNGLDENISATNLSSQVLKGMLIFLNVAILGFVKPWFVCVVN